MARDEPEPRITAVRGDADVAIWVEVHNRASPCQPEGVDSLRHYWERAPAWRSAIAWREERPVGVGHVQVEHWSPDSRHAEVWIVVAKEERWTGIGTALFRDVSAWARERKLEGCDVYVYEDEPHAPGFWARRGFVEVGRERQSRLDLGAPPVPSAAAPDGIELETLAGRSDLERGMYEVASEAFRDVPGPEVYDVGDFDHWRDGDLRIPGLLEACSVVALDAGLVVGFAVLAAYEARPGVAQHQMTAVARSHRGRGVATAMKRRQIELARAAGLVALEAANEERNAPMRAVNERLGYMPLPAVIQLRGPLLG